MRPKGPFPALDHDHGPCLAKALKRARECCAEKGVRWTALREQVFLQVAMSHKPVGAYELIELLAIQGRRLAPVSIYRVLEVLLNAGLIHRLESRNAFFACMREHRGAPPTIVFLCEDCKRVAEAEAPDAVSAIARSIEEGHFHIRNTILEVSGICEECATASASR